MVSMLDRLHFTMKLKLASDLHIGTGERERLSADQTKQPANDADAAPPEVALVARGFDGKPIIPATAIKSALRRELRDEALSNRLFGSIKSAGGTGNVGCIWLEAASWKSSPSDCPDLPHWCGGNRQAFIQTHVAIDRKSRTALGQKLYCVERVPAGTVFELSGEILATDSEARDHLERISSLLSHGILLGADERHGAGKVVLEGVPVYVRHWFDAASAERVSDGAKSFQWNSKAATRTAAPAIRLECLGPYVSLDNTKLEGNLRGAARRAPNQPTLSPASLLGVLRTRCAWLSWTIADLTARGDDPFRDAISRDNIGELTSTERLFGVNGWRGLVRLVSLALEGVPARPYTSVAIDRFTQGPLDEALYSTEIFVGNRLSFALELEQRAGFPTTEDHKLFGALVADVRARGLMLGHGTNKGFGWFEPQALQPAQTASGRGQGRQG